MKIKVGVFFGGKSVEHEVSIITAMQAMENMDKEKYDLIPIYIAKDNRMYCGKLLGNIENYEDIAKLLTHSIQVTLVQKEKKVALMKINKKIGEKAIYDYIDVAFPIVHGTNVEDGTLQGFLKMFNLPYVGCDVLASSVGMDKYVTKCVLKDNNIPVLDCICIHKEDYYENNERIVKNIAAKYGYPVIVKPINLGSSVGIKIAKNKDELKEALEDAFMYAAKVLCEKAITNLKEVNCSVMGDYELVKASECEEPVKTEEILSYKDKYQSNNGLKSGQKIGIAKSMNAAVLKLPADITKEEKEKIQQLAIKTFQVLGCSGVIRIDFLIDLDTLEIYVNELNTIPGSLSFHLWQATGVNYTKLLDELITLALKRHREEQNITFSFPSNILAGLSMQNLKTGHK